MTKMNWAKASREYRLAQGQGYWDRGDQADEAWYEREKEREAYIVERRAARAGKTSSGSPPSSSPRRWNAKKKQKKGTKSNGRTNAEKRAATNRRRRDEARRLGISEAELRARRRSESEENRAAKIAALRSTMDIRSTEPIASRSAPTDGGRSQGRVPQR